jgi:ABC-type sulfate/molybdate transport systems ATPase subunit
MIAFEIRARRGHFQLDITSEFVAPWTVVFGPSAAGKTTLLRMLAGLDALRKPDYGRIAVHGRYVTDTEIGLNMRPGSHPAQRSAGMVTQQPALFPHLSVTANIAYGLPSLSPSLRSTRINSVLELVGAGHLAVRMPSALSGGEAQRVALARALAPMPQLLLLDEPLSALDASARDEVLARLRDWLAEQKIQTVLVTHDAADALATRAEVVLMLEGRLIAQGPAAQVLAAERRRLLDRLAIDEDRQIETSPVQNVSARKKSVRKKP